jgi:cytochrome c-type biogenesis protein CcmH/NrfG
MSVSPIKSLPVLLALLGAAAPRAFAADLTAETLIEPGIVLRRDPKPWLAAEGLLEAGEIEAVESFVAGLRLPKEAEAAGKLNSLLALYRGDPAAALAALEGLRADDWVLSRRAYLEGLLAAAQGMEESVTDHFRVRAAADDAFLAQYAARALESARSKMAEVFGAASAAGVPAEIYPTQEAFSRASTLSPETLERSGAIGICKFRRLMVLSPRETPLGYRWLDALAHEYNHYLINELSGTLCPLWLHEGVARYYETAWRRAGPFEHAPAAETALAEASGALAVQSSTAPAEGGAPAEASTGPALIPFSRMEPSMVYLEDQDQVALAFAQVSDAVAYLVEEFGPGKLRELLQAFRVSFRSQAFEKVLGMTEEEFEASWRDSLKDRAWTVSKGALAQKIRLDRVDETELAGPDVQGHIRLGDRLRQQDQPAAAVIQYRKALEKEPDNGVALLKLARAQLAQDEEAAAEEALRRAVSKNTSYITPFVALGELLYDQGRYEEAQPLLEEGLEINPFDPRLHKYLGLIAVDIGHFQAAKQALELALKLGPDDEEVRQVLRQMPRQK